jgi:hypothetical protein
MNPSCANRIFYTVLMTVPFTATGGAGAPIVNPSCMRTRPAPQVERMFLASVLPPLCRYIAAIITGTVIVFSRAFVGVF